ncbi:MAG TPA: hypothetical protein VN660_06010 [Steroidobacteraceae bacterium]|nr:hypothetical protein [Steroidobacteraceae bacterium]
MKKSPLALVVPFCVSLLYTSAVLAQVDLSGTWALQSDTIDAGDGRVADDFAGIPLNAQGQAAGLAWTEDERQELQRQCEPWSPDYIITGLWGGRFTAIRDRFGTVHGWNVTISVYDRLPMNIWTDGRAPPSPEALHTYSGYTSGKWEGNTLHTMTTHLKDNFIERNGTPGSNQETYEMFMTPHGDQMAITGVIRDPVYLAAPWVIAATLARRVDTGAAVNNSVLYCMPAELEAVSDGYHAAAELPDSIQSLKMYETKHYNIPLDAALGGPETQYPEFRKRMLSEGYKPPTEYCKNDCCDFGSRICRNPN